MCKTKSMLVYNLGKSVYCPFDHNDHKLMLNEMSLKENTDNPNYVKIEINPEDNNVFNHDIDNWGYKVNQDILPDWYDDKQAQALCYAKLQEWFNERFVIDKRKKTVIKGGIWHTKNSNIEARNCEIEADDHCKIKAWNCVIEARGNCDIKAWDNSKIKAYNCKCLIGEYCEIEIMDATKN